MKKASLIGMGKGSMYRLLIMSAVSPNSPCRFATDQCWHRVIRRIAVCARLRFVSIAAASSNKMPLRLASKGAGATSHVQWKASRELICRRPSYPILICQAVQCRIASCRLNSRLTMGAPVDRNAQLNPIAQVRNRIQQVEVEIIAQNEIIAVLEQSGRDAREARAIRHSSGSLRSQSSPKWSACLRK